MDLFLIYVRDEDFSRLLPRELDRSGLGNGRVQVMAFPPLGIQTLAPVLRQEKLIDDLKAQIQAALGKTTAGDAASALGGALGGQK